MAAVLGQYIRDNKLTEKTGLTQRQLINSLLMSTATPVINPESGKYYAVMNQGAGLANVGNAVNAQSYVLVKENLSGTASDGKVKAELGDDPDRTGDYTVDFSVTNFSDEDTEYTFSADMFTQDMFADGGYTYLDTYTKPDAVCMNADCTDFSVIFTVSKYKNGEYELGVVLDYTKENAAEPAYAYYKLGKTFTVEKGAIVQQNDSSDQPFGAATGSDADSQGLSFSIAASNAAASSETAAPGVKEFQAPEETATAAPRTDAFGAALDDTASIG